MIALTDYALFNTIMSELNIENGVFSPADRAFKDYEKRFDTDLNLPLFSLFWTTISRDSTQWNLPQARFGDLSQKLATLNSGRKVKVIPVRVEYILGIWTLGQMELIEKLRDVFFFSSREGGNGATVSFRDIPESQLSSADSIVIEALEGFSFDLEINMDGVTLEKSDPTTDVGKHYKSEVTITANTFMTKGLQLPLVRKIVLDLYASNSSTIGDYTDTELITTITREAE